MKTKSTSKLKLYRQGDIMLERVEKLPSDAKSESVEGPVILAYGEVTGHHHAIRTRNVSVFKSGTTTFIEVKGPAVPDVAIPNVDALLSKMRNVALLTHEEHSPISLELGVYKLHHQREYSPQEIRRVAD